jgi:hypothetical protein
MDGGWYPKKIATLYEFKLAVSREDRLSSAKENRRL